MISKKDAVTLGMLAVGGVGAAMVVGGGGGGGDSDLSGGAMEGRRGRAGGILGTSAGAPTAPTVYQFAAQPAVTFPKAPTFDVGKMMVPTVDPKKAALEKYYARQAKGRWMIDPRKVRSIMREPLVTEKPYTPGVTKFEPYRAPSYTPSPKKPDVKFPKYTYTPFRALPAAIGIHTALEYARKPKSRGAQGVSAPPKKEIEK